jgi:hypothetical protein
MNWFINYIFKYANLNDKINLLSKKYKIEPTIINKLIQLDPTPNKTYLDWITKLYKNNNRILEDKDKFLHSLSIFHTKKHLFHNLDISNDINKYKSLGELDTILNEKKLDNTVSKREQVRLNETKGQEVVYQDGVYSVIDIKTPEAASKLLRNTKLCVKNPETFNKYNINENNKLLLITKNNERYLLLNEESKQLMDIYDNQLSSEEYISIKPLLKKLWKKGILKQPPIIFSRNKEKDINEYSYDEVKKYPSLAYDYCAFKNNSQPIKELEPTIARNAELSYYYANSILGGEFKLGEKIIATNALNSYLYARDVLKGPFKLGEVAIAKDADYSYLYARDVLKGPFKLGEEAIATNAYYSYLYAKDILKGPFKLGEEAIATNDAYYNYLYARDVLKGPFKLGEEAIATNAYYSYLYAKDILKGPFKLGEEAIATNDAYYNYLYAKDVLKKRFELGESAIAKNVELWKLYKHILFPKAFNLDTNIIGEAANAYYSSFLSDDSIF